MMTQHINERKDRIAIIEKIGYGKPVVTITVDNGHRNGAEEQTLSTTGIVTIRNKRTRKVITYLIARPGQLKRFFVDTIIPEDLLEIARIHQRMGYNMA